MRISRILKILCIISTTMVVTGFKEPLSPMPASKASHKGRWSIPTAIGVSWKPKAEAINNVWVGFVATTGIKWEHQFCKRYTFSAGLLWGLFLPDMFVANKPTEYRFKLIKNFVIPYNLALLLPMTSLQLGYLVNNHWHLSCGLIYLCALELNVNYLISQKIALHTKYCFFLDKFFKNHGIHLGFATIGIDYKL